MKRHTKLDIVELPPPTFSSSRISMSFDECSAYNTFVSSVQTNLLMTSMEGKTSGAQDSLLHRSQSMNARSTLRSVRRVCSGFGRAIPTLTPANYAAFLQCAHTSGLSKSARENVCSYVDKAKNEKLVACELCHLELSILVAMSCCGGVICTECMVNSTNVCFLCDSEFDVDELQAFQPGFVVSWKDDRETSIIQHAIAPEDAYSTSQLAAPLVRPQKTRRKTRRAGDGHTCEYDPFSGDGVCDLCLEEHDTCNLLNNRNRCEICHRIAEECPKSESKASYLVERLLALHNLQKSSLDRCHSPMPTPRNSTAAQVRPGHARPLKVIVFSQFRAALNVVGDRLLKRFGTACVAEYFGVHRRKELSKFIHSSDCFILLLTKDGGEGLDLSFVTNIFFLEAIYDQAVAHQAVARAWRMGATQSVQVETLVAKNSVEETMAQQARGTSEPLVGAAGDQQRLKSLLQSLSFITDFHHFASSVSMHKAPVADLRALPEKSSNLNLRKRQHSAAESCLLETGSEKKVRFSLPEP